MTYKLTIMQKTFFLVLIIFIISSFTANAQDTLRLSKQEDVQKVFENLQQDIGKEDTQTVLIIEPGIYWLDNPDDKAVRMNPNGEGTPYAVKINRHNLKIIGTDSNPKNTILAVNRGQTQGAIGNFTMILFNGKKLYTENITYGNYCNVDLIYPKDPSQNRAKRNNAVVQAQLAHCVGTDSVTAKNCRFISRLNLCNFTGAKHAEFYNCYMECTDDALAGNSIYKNCKFTFYSSKPFYATGKGTVFDDCDIYVKTYGKQYITKATSPVTLIDTRFHCGHSIKFGWCKDNDPSICKAINVTLNGKKVKFDNKKHIFKVEKLEMLNGSKRIGNAIYNFDAYETDDTRSQNWTVNNNIPSWYYGTAPDGAEGHTGYVQNQKGARITITPDNGNTEKRNTYISITACPCKSAGQGFGSALDQYMDICLNMDMKTITGYGLRIQRTPEYDHAVVIMLIKYTNGKVTHITEPQKCELFKTACKIIVSLNGGVLTAKLKHNSDVQEISTSNITCNEKLSHLQFMIQHTGSVGASATLLKDIKIH